MKKRTLVVLVVLLLLLGVGSFTYARYVTSYNGTGTAEIAKWAVALKQGGAAVSETFDLNLTLSSNENVAAGKIAPGRKATATLQLDLTGTEVTSDVEFDLSDITGLPAGMEITNVSIKNGAEVFPTTSGDDQVYTGTITYSSDNKVLDVVITLEWVNNEANNATDTTAGKNAGTLSIPVKVTVKQHI